MSPPSRGKARPGAAKRRDYGTDPGPRAPSGAAPERWLIHPGQGTANERQWRSGKEALEELR